MPCDDRVRGTLGLQPVDGRCSLPLNERGCGRALSRAKFMKGPGRKGRGAGPVFVCSFLQAVPVWAQLVFDLVCRPSGFTHSEAAQVSSAKAERVWMAVPGNPLYTACWQSSIRVRSGSGDPNMLRGALRLPEAASRRSRDSRPAHLGGQVEPCSAANHPDMAATPSPGRRFLLGCCSTCSRREPRSHSRTEARTRWISYDVTRPTGGMQG